MLHTTHHLTAWIDDDHDGFFDRRIEEEEGRETGSTVVRIQVPVRIDP